AVDRPPVLPAPSTTRTTPRPPSSGIGACTWCEHVAQPPAPQTSGRSRTSVAHENLGTGPPRRRREADPSSHHTGAGPGVPRRIPQGEGAPGRARRHEPHRRQRRCGEGRRTEHPGCPAKGAAVHSRESVWPRCRTPSCDGGSPMPDWINLPEWAGQVFSLSLSLTHWQELGLAFLLGSFAVATWSDIKHLAAQREFLEIWLGFLAGVLLL